MQEQAAYYERIASGGAAVVTIGNCSINMNETSDEIHQLDLPHDKVIFGLNVLREKCERYNAHLSAQRGCPRIRNHRLRGADGSMKGMALLRYRGILRRCYAFIRFDPRSVDGDGGPAKGSERPHRL